MTCTARAAWLAVLLALPAPASGASPATLGALVSIDAAGLRALVRDGRARATIVNVWATWCVPCREEMPELVAAARARRGRGLRLVLVCTDFEEQRPQAVRFLARLGVRDTTYWKSGGDQAFIDGLERRWSGALPATVVYDARGRERAFWEGKATRAKFERAADQALTAPPPERGATP